MRFDFLKKKENSQQGMEQRNMLTEVDEHGITMADVERLTKEAGHMVAMFEQVYPDRTERLRVVSALAGYACHQAVKSNGEAFVTVQTKDNREYYFGDGVNYYLLEGPFSVLVFMKGYYKKTVMNPRPLDVHGVVQKAVSNVGNDLYRIWNQEFPDLLYGRIKECWNGIYHNMTAKYCRNAAEWPVLFGIVLQNIMFQSEMNGEETFYKALECVLFMSKMDDKSVKHKDLESVGNDVLYSFYQDGRMLPLSNEDEVFLHTSIDTLREFFKENKIAFDVTNRGQEAKIIHFKMVIQGEVSDILIGIYMKPKMCSIVFNFPFVADRTKENELCKKLMKYNVSRRFGAFQYDAEDGEISYKTDFPCLAGINKEDFVAAFIISMNSVSNFMAELKPYVVHR